MLKPKGEPLRSRVARESAERALVRIVHQYGERPGFVVIGGWFRSCFVLEVHSITQGQPMWMYK